MKLRRTLRRFSLTMSVAISCLAPVPGAWAEMPTLHILTDEYPPYSYKTADGTITGLATEKVIALMEEAKLPYDLTMMAWPRALNRAQRDANTLIYSLSYTEERASHFHWILPLKRAEFHLFGRNAPELRTLTKEDILKGPFRGICGAKTQQCHLLERYGFPLERILRPADSTTGERVQLMLRGRADFIVAEPRVIGWHIDQAEIPMDAIRSYDIVDHSITDYLAASKSTAPAIIARLHEAARNIPMIDAPSTHPNPQ